MKAFNLWSFLHFVFFESSVFHSRKKFKIYKINSTDLTSCIKCNVKNNGDSCNMHVYSCIECIISFNRGPSMFYCHNRRKTAQLVVCGRKTSNNVERRKKEDKNPKQIRTKDNVSVFQTVRPFQTVWPTAPTPKLPVLPNRWTFEKQREKHSPNVLLARVMYALRDLVYISRRRSAVRRSCDLQRVASSLYVTKYAETFSVTQLLKLAGTM